MRMIHGQRVFSLAMTSAERNAHRAQGRKLAKEAHGRLAKVHHCPCGSVAEVKKRGDWVCARCLRIEEKLELLAQFRENRCL